jgi:hypothetical protein
MSKYSNILDEYVFTARSMFYLLSPNETYFKNIENVPPVVEQVTQ